MSFDDLFGKRTVTPEIEGLKKGLEKFMELAFNAFGKLELKIKELEKKFTALENRLGANASLSTPSLSPSLSLSSSSGLPPPPSLPSAPTATASDKGRLSPPPPEPSSGSSSIYSQIGSQLQQKEGGHTPQQSPGTELSPTPETPTKEQETPTAVHAGVSLQAELQSELSEAFKKIRARMEEES
ncbi:MAG: hypothetical protein ACFFBD_19740 [Candidatus Hodarchaeota archaeon]